MEINRLCLAVFSGVLAVICIDTSNAAPVGNLAGAVLALLQSVDRGDITVAWNFLTPGLRHRTRPGDWSFLEPTGRFSHRYRAGHTRMDGPGVAEVAAELDLADPLPPA